MELPPTSPSRPRSVAAEAARPEDPAAALARSQAEAFEAAFLEEMLKHSGINRTPGTTGGGAGEEAFSSFLTREYAALLARNGGVGLAEQVFNAIHQKGSGS